MGWTPACVPSPSAAKYTYTAISERKEEEQKDAVCNNVTCFMYSTRVSMWQDRKSEISFLMVPVMK